MTLKEKLNNIILTESQKITIKENLDSFYDSLNEEEIDDHYYKCVTEADYEDNFLLEIYKKSNVEVSLNG